MAGGPTDLQMGGSGKGMALGDVRGLGGCRVRSVVCSVMCNACSGGGGGVGNPLLCGSDLGRPLKYCA